MKALYEGLKELLWQLKFPPKAIKVTSDFYNYIVARAINGAFWLENNQVGVITYLMGIKLIIDNTIEDKYCEFEF